jgi:hypothetical protein
MCEKSFAGFMFFMFWNNQQDAVQSRLYLFYCQVTLHISGVSRTYHQEYINCSYTHWHKS